MRLMRFFFEPLFFSLLLFVGRYMYVPIRNNVTEWLKIKIKKINVT